MGGGSPWNDDWYAQFTARPKDWPDDGAQHWTTWSGVVDVAAVSLGAPPPPPQEVARIECPSPRAIVIAIHAEPAAGQTVTFRVRVGAGRSELVVPFAKTFGTLPTITIIPGRIVIVDVQLSAGAVPPSIRCTASLAPLQPWF